MIKPIKLIIYYYGISKNIRDAVGVNWKRHTHGERKKRRKEIESKRDPNFRF